MSDYIEREQAVTVFKTFYGKPLRIMLEALAEEHAADVRLVVHGKWIMNDDSKTVCSLCGNVVAFVSHPDKRWDFGYFCPNCGADMREEGEPHG